MMPSGASFVTPLKGQTTDSSADFECARATRGQPPV